MMNMDQAQQDLISLKSGLWDLQEYPDKLLSLVRDGFICKDGAQLFLKEEYNSDAEIVINDNNENYKELAKAIPAMG